MLLSWANVHFYQELMGRARDAIARGEFAAYAEDVKARYSGSTRNGEGRVAIHPACHCPA